MGSRQLRRRRPRSRSSGVAARSGTVPAAAGAGARSERTGICEGDGTGGRDNSSVEQGRELYYRAPAHNRAPELEVHENVPHGTLHEFIMSSADSRFYPGIARDAPDPKDPTNVVNTSHPAAYTRHISVYVPKQYVPGTAAPFLVGADGLDHAWPKVFDKMIAAHRLPVMIGVFISPGGGDPHGSERGLEYDIMFGRYAEFESEVLPLVEKNYNVKLTKDRTATRRWERARAGRRR